MSNGDFWDVTEAGSNAQPLAPDARPHWATARDGSAYVRISIYPRTLNELRKYSRHFGRAVARDTEWSCITIWLMNDPPASDLTNDPAVVRTAVRLVREYDRFRFDCPRHDGQPSKRPDLYLISPDVRPEALRVAAETLADWRAAERPHLEPHIIKQSYQRLVSSPAYIKRYVRQPDDNKEQE